MSLSDVHLILVRHATAVDVSDTGRDEDRSLTRDGYRESQRLASAVKALGIPDPEWTLSSGYLRAEQTLAAFDWFRCNEKKDIAVSPFGQVREAKRLLREQIDGGARVIWIFSHNPFLTVFLESCAPSAFEGVRRFRKSELVWLRWALPIDALERKAQLRAYLPKPQLGGA